MFEDFVRLMAASEEDLVQRNVDEGGTSFSLRGAVGSLMTI